MRYLRFFAMIMTSGVVMYIIMYFNTFLLEHVFFSETRLYMTFVMVAAMAVIMLSFMLHMYSRRTLNIAIFLGSVFIFTMALWLVRSQVTVGDLSYMRAMIPHHSIAIMTSSRAGIEDSRVRKLADEIVYAQDKEIAEMRYMIADIERSGLREHSKRRSSSPVVSVEEALETPNIASLDAEFLTEEDISQLFASTPPCVFEYTTESRPALAIGEADGGVIGLLKISDDLVLLEPRQDVGESRWSKLEALGLSIDLLPVSEGDSIGDASEVPMLTDMLLRLPGEREIGYRGYYRCPGYGR